MLHLVLADRHHVGAIEQNVRRLQHGIVEDPGVHALLALRLLLELRLSLELTERRDRVEDPGQLGMFRNLRLHEQRGARSDRCPPTSSDDRHLAPALAQLRRARSARDRVVVDDADDRLELVLQLRPVLHRAEVVADVQLPGRLNPTEDP